MNVVGWLKWQPGQNYQIKITVRMKERVQASPKDQIFRQNIESSRKSKVFDPAWKSYKSVVLTETAGMTGKPNRWRYSRIYPMKQMISKGYQSSGEYVAMN